MGFITAAQRFDVVSLGDVVTDMIVRLPEDIVPLGSDERGSWLEIPLGTKLVVEDDTEDSLGGSAANAAAAMSLLGLRVGLSTFLAHDEVGLNILRALHAVDVDTSLVHVDTPSRTIRNIVLSYAGERTILVRHAEFSYQWKDFRDFEVPTWLFVNSMGPDSLDYHDQIATWLDHHGSTRLAFQPGTFQIEAGVRRLARLYARSEVVVCTHAGARKLAEGATDDPGGLLDFITGLGARAAVIIEDDGGAVAANNVERVRIAPFSDGQAPIDRTGYNDSFAATVVASIIGGVGLRDALRRAAVNAESVTHQWGAQAGLLHEKEINDRLEKSATAFAALDL